MAKIDGQQKLLIGALRGELELNYWAHRNRVKDKNGYALQAATTLEDLFFRLDNASCQEEFDYTYTAFKNFILYLRQSTVSCDSENPAVTNNLYQLEKVLYDFSFDCRAERAEPFLKELNELANSNVLDTEKKQLIQELMLHYNNRDRVLFHQVGLALLEKINTDPLHHQFEIVRMNHVFDDLQKKVDDQFEKKRPTLDRVTSKEELALDFVPGYMGTAIGIAGLATALVAFPPIAIVITVAAFIPPIVDFSMATFAVAKKTPAEETTKPTSEDHEDTIEPKAPKKSFFSKMKDFVSEKKVPLVLSAVALASLAMTIVGTAGLAVVPLAIAGLSLTVGVVLGLGIKHIYQRVKLSNSKEKVEGVVKDTIDVSNEMEKAPTLENPNEQATRSAMFKQAAVEQITLNTDSFAINRPQVTVEKKNIVTDPNTYKGKHQEYLLALKEETATPKEEKAPAKNDGHPSGN